MTRVLLVEDDAETGESVTLHLRSCGFAVQHETAAETALADSRYTTWDIAIIDRMLPGLDGLSLVRALRADGIETPVLLLTALGAVDDRIAGLRAGGDDYLVKPFDLGELTARIEVLLRRPPLGGTLLLRVGPIELDLVARKARRGPRELDLLPREFQLLEYLARREDQTVTRAMLLRDIWHYNFEVQTNLVDVHVGRLRRKLEADGDTPLISNIRGVGFRFRVET